MSAHTEHDQELPEGFEVGGTFRVTSEEKAAWVVNKLLTYDEQLARLDAQHAKMRAQLLARRDSFSAMFLAPLRQWAEANPPLKGKTIHLLTGSLSFRRVKRSAKVVDPKAALRWAEDNLPEAIQVTVQKKPDAAYLASYFESTGEIPDGVTILGDHDEFYVRAPKPESEEF